MKGLKSMSSEKIVFMMMTDRRIIDAKDWMKKYFNPAMLEKKKFFLNTNIGIKNINAPIIPNSQHGQNNSFLNSFTSIKDNLRNPNASEYSLEIK